MELSWNPVEKKNAKLFVLFRLFFNCRFYYPILTVLFLDFGLSLQQYSLLNVVWAISIVCFEVPSGALADLLGRKRLVVFSSFLMICEMAVLLFAPRVSSSIFALCILNRLLSGLAEASASGADEALVYDSLDESQREQKWAQILSRTMRYQSMLMAVAMLLGAFLYDWNSLIRIFPALSEVLSRDIVLRIPVAITFLMGIGAFMTTLQFVEIREYEKLSRGLFTRSLKESLLQIREVGLWILKHEAVVALLLIGLVMDSSIRLFATLNSQFLRSLAIPESYYGIIGASMTFVGVFSSRLGAFLVSHYSSKKIFTGLSLFIFLSFLGIFFDRNLSALIFVFSAFFAMFLVGFLMSHFLNSFATSKIRATLLSFKGLAFNLAFAWVALLYAGNAQDVKGEFQSTLGFFYQYFIGMLVATFLLFKIYKASSFARKGVA